MDNRLDNNTLTPTKRIISYRQSRVTSPPRSNKINISPNSNQNRSSISSPRKRTSSRNTIMHYQQKIACLENTISNLEKLNNQIMRDAKSNQKQLECLLYRTKQELNKKCSKVGYLQETISKMNIIMFENNQNKRCQSRSRPETSRRKTEQKNQQNGDKNSSRLGIGITEQVIIELKNQLQEVKHIIDSKSLQITKLKSNLKQKEQILQKMQEQHQNLKNELQNKQKYYEKVIEQKESTIRKMAQFNDDICSKLMQQNNNCLSKTQKKKLELVLHDNKALKEKCSDLHNKNMELEQEISNFVHKCKDMKVIRQEILRIIENQKITINNKNIQIQALKYQILQSRNNHDRELRTKISPRLKENSHLSKTINPIKRKHFGDYEQPYFQQCQSTCDNQSANIRHKNIQIFQQNFQKFRKLHNYISKNQLIQECSEQEQPFINRLALENRHHMPQSTHGSPKFNDNHILRAKKIDVAKNSNQLKKRSITIHDPQNLTFAFDDTIQMPENNEEN